MAAKSENIVRMSTTTFCFHHQGEIGYAGQRRVRPALMTAATTILALLPILTSSGRGSDVMIPMAIPSFGGMIIELLTIFLAPVLYCLIKEKQAHQK